MRATALAWGAPPLPPWSWVDGRWPVLRRAERLAHGLFLVEVRPAAAGVVLRIHGRDADDAAVVAPLAARIRRALHLDDGPRARRARMRSAGTAGLRGTTLFEDAVQAILGHPEKDIRSALGPLCVLAGRTRLDSRARAFPSPSHVVAAAERRRAVPDAVVRLARAITSGTHDLAMLDVDADRLDVAALGALPGVDAATLARLLRLLGGDDRRRVATAQSVGPSESAPTKALTMATQSGFCRSGTLRRRSRTSPK